jgi:hypothetical protein
MFYFYYTMVVKGGRGSCKYAQEDFTAEDAKLGTTKDMKDTKGSQRV